MCFASPHPPPPSAALRAGLSRGGGGNEEGRVRTTTPSLERRFSALPPCRMVLEVGTHSPWMSRLLAGFGHQVIVANPRQVRLIAEGGRKRDRRHAHLLRPP